MKRIYLLAYITILCCLCPLLKAQLGPMPFTPVPPNDPSLVRLLNSDVRCRQWVDSVMQRLTLKERIGQLFIYTIAPQQDKANKELLRKVVEDYKVGGLLFTVKGNHQRNFRHPLRLIGQHHLVLHQSAGE